MTQRKATVFLFIVAVIWGGGFPAVKIALTTGITPFYLITARFSIAAIILFVFKYKAMKPYLKSHLLPGLLLGAFLFLGFAFQTFGIEYTTPSKNAFLTSTYVVMAPFIYWIVSKHFPDKYTLIGAALTIVGVGFLTLNDTLAVNIGDVLTLICALFFALHIIFIGHYSREDSEMKADPLTLVFYQMVFAATLALIAALIFEPFNAAPQIEGVMAIIYLGVFSTMVAFFLQNYAQKLVSESQSAIILATESVFGALFSVLLLSEQMTINLIIGFTLVFIAIIITETKLSFINK